MNMCILQMGIGVISLCIYIYIQVHVFMFGSKYKLHVVGLSMVCWIRASYNWRFVLNYVYGPHIAGNRPHKTVYGRHIFMCTNHKTGGQPHMDGC